MKRRGKKFVVRTIKNGSVQINGLKFSPDLDASRFNGQRATFGLYYIGTKWDSRVIFLWGSEQEYLHHGSDYPGPFCEDGMFKWEWWNQTALISGRYEERTPKEGMYLFGDCFPPNCKAYILQIFREVIESSGLGVNEWLRSTSLKSTSKGTFDRRTRHAITYYSTAPSSLL